MSDKQKEKPNLLACFLFMFPVTVPGLAKLMNATKDQGLLWSSYVYIGTAILFIFLYFLRIGTHRKSYLIMSPILFILGIFLGL